MTAETNRRAVLGAAAATMTVASLGGRAFASPRPYRVGVVGSGWFGKLNAHALMQVAPAQVVAMCDVDRHMLEEAGKWIAARPDSMVKPAREPQLYGDFRTMLAKHKFDIVIVATPDHWHTLPAIAAMQAGAHVYIEKPVSVDVVEGRALVATARANNRVVQVGTQRRNSPCHIEARERFVRTGKLGKVGYVEVFGYYHQRPPKFAANTTPPKYLDWNFYCGPAPLVAYNPDIHPLQWRAFREFGNGYIGDLGVHFVDTCRWMLDLGWPRRVSSVGGVYVDKQSVSTVPDTQTAQFEFDDLLMSWGNREWGSIPVDATGWGAIIYGERGTLKLGSTSYEFVPLEGGDSVSANLDAEYTKFPHDKDLGNTDMALMALTRPNMRDFVGAIEGGRLAAADIEQGFISTSSVILANIAMDLGRPVRWDAKDLRVIGDDEAQKRLARTYRAPWVHPGLA
jgi:predicted dehydrogenase